MEFKQKNLFLIFVKERRSSALPVQLITLFITHDFLMEILSFGEYVKVIQPENLIAELKSTFKKALNQYRAKSNLNLDTLH